MQIRQEASDPRDVGGFVGTHLPDRLGAEVGAVGLHHESIEGDEFGRFGHFWSGSKGHDTGETDPGSEFDDRSGFVWLAREAMEYEPIRGEISFVQDLKQIR